MAMDVHRRGHPIEGLSIVAGAVHLSDAGPKNNVQPAVLRASYQYVGVSSSSGEAQHRQLSSRHRVDSFGPKLVEGDYTYTTSRKNLMVSSQLVGTGPLLLGGLSAAPSATSTTPRGTIPAMVPVHSANVNTAAWRAFGSPRTRSHQRPPLAPGAAGVTGPTGPGPAPGSPTGSKLPRVGGFKPRRPQSAPGIGADGPSSPRDLDTTISAIASSVSIGAAAKRRAATRDTADMVDVSTLVVEQPDPIWAGRTDSGRLMFEYTLPTDPYAKYMWEEQARKARANMSRHLGASAAAAAVNVGGGGGSSRPSSAMRGVGGQAAAAAVAGGGLGVSGTSAARPRFSSTTLSDVLRQGPEFKPHTVVGFAAPDMTDDTTMPGPGDPRWAYTRLGRSQLTRLQQSLKMCIAPKHIMRPASAPSLGVGGGVGGMATANSGISVAIAAGAESSNSASCVGVAIGSRERSMVHDELSALDPLADPMQGGVPTTASVSFAVGSTGSGLLRPGSAGLARPGSAGPGRPGSGGPGRPGSAGPGRLSFTSLARAGSPSQQRPGSAGIARPNSAGVMRSGSVSATGGASSAVNVAAAALAAEAGAPAVPAVRGASAGRTREAAPNPRVDLRMYLADAAEAEDDEEGTEILPVGDLAAGGLLFDGAGGVTGVLVGPDGLPLPPEVLQSMPVPADQLAARLAEMVAAVAVVAAQKQMDGDDELTSPNRPHVHIEHVDHQGEDGGDQVGNQVAPAVAAVDEEPPQPPLDEHLLRPEGEDALSKLHGTSTFGGRPSSRHTSHSPSPYLSQPEPNEEEDVVEWDISPTAAPPTEQPLGLGLGLGPKPFSRAGGRPTSARPTSARPTSVVPGRHSVSPVQGLGDGGGMDVIIEQSEGGEHCDEF